MKLKGPLTLPEHLENGRFLHQCMNEIAHIRVLISNHYGKTHRATKKARLAWKAVNALCSAMDDLACRELPDDCDAPLIYYGKAGSYEEKKRAMRDTEPRELTRLVHE